MSETYLMYGPAAKRKRYSITLEMKLDILNRYDRGERTADIKRLLGINESTLRSIRDTAAKIRESSKTASLLSAFRFTASRPSIMERMEQQLIAWVEEQNENNVRVTNSTVKEMAKQLYEDLRNSNPDVNAKPFNASCGWLERFKMRHGLTSFNKTVDENSAVATSRPPVMEHMEQQLITWLEEQNKNNIGVTNSTVKDMAKQLYEDLRKSNGYVDAKPFNASPGWFERFKLRHGLTSFSNSKMILENTAVTIPRPPIMEHMEQRLIAWVEEQNENNVSITNSVVKEMAKQLYEDLGKSSAYIDVKPFSASCGWFDRFKRRHGLTSFSKSKTVDENSDIVSRSSIMGHMEQRLISWLEEQNKNNVRVSNSAVKDMARQLYEDLQISNPDVDAKPFNASCGWFDRFKRRHGFTSFTNKSKTVDENCTLDNFMDAFRALVNENSYSPKQVFNLQETGLYWKRMPNKWFLSTDQEVVTGITSQNDRCTLLLGGNAAGDYRIKPLMVCHTDSPAVLMGSSETHLPIVWRSSNSGLITSKIFGDYFVSQLHQELKAYCENEGLPFKILLLLDMDMAYPPNLVDLSNNIRVLFLPTKIPASIQPMDQGVTTMFKSCYHHQLFTKLISSTEVKGKSFVTDFLNSFNLKMAIDVIAEAWTQLNEQFMREAWRQIWPEILEDSENYLISEDISNVRLSILDMAKSAGFTEVDERDIEDLIESHSFEISNDNCQEIKVENHEETGDSASDNDQQIKEEHHIGTGNSDNDQQIKEEHHVGTWNSASFNDQQIKEEHLGTWNSASFSDQQIKEEHNLGTGNSATDNESVRALSTETLFQICHLGDQMISLIDENDPDRERSSQVAKYFQNVLACYRELYRENIEHADRISANTFSVKYK